MYKHNGGVQKRKGPQDKDTGRAQCESSQFFKKFCVWLLYNVLIYAV